MTTAVTVDATRTILARNDRPDVPFEVSINPYRGCEHGCVDCFARPTHAYLGFSPGIDFETRILAKPDAAALLRRELAKPGYRCSPMAFNVAARMLTRGPRERHVAKNVRAVAGEAGGWAR